MWQPAQPVRQSNSLVGATRTVFGEGFGVARGVHLDRRRSLASGPHARRSAALTSRSVHRLYRLTVSNGQWCNSKDGSSRYLRKLRISPISSLHKFAH